MSTHEIFFAVLAGLVALFAAATAWGTRLANRTEDAAQLAFVGRLNGRIRGAWGVVALFAIAFALGGWAVLLIFAVASFLALRDFMALTPIRASDYWALVVAFYVAIPVQYVLIAGGWYGWYAVFIPVYLFLALPVIMALKQDTERYLERVAKVQWGLMISVYCVSHAPALATLHLPGHEDRGALLLLFFLLVVMLSDVFTLIASATFAGTPLASNPNKTREGALIGGLAATFLGTLLWWLTPFSWWQATLMAAAIVTAGFLGGVVLAAVKRSLGVRDQWTETGVNLSRGVLERLDAVSFAAPVFFHLTVYFFGN